MFEVAIVLLRVPTVLRLPFLGVALLVRYVAYVGERRAFRLDGSLGRCARVGSFVFSARVRSGDVFECAEAWRHFIVQYCFTVAYGVGVAGVSNFEAFNCHDLVVPIACFVVNRGCSIHFVPVGRLRQVASGRVTAIACRAVILNRVSRARYRCLVVGGERVAVGVVVRLAGYVLVACFGLPAFVFRLANVCLQCAWSRGQEVAYDQLVRCVYDLAVRVEDVGYRLVVGRYDLGAGVNDADALPLRAQVRVDDGDYSLYMRSTGCVILFLPWEMCQLVEVIASVVVARCAMEDFRFWVVGRERVFVFLPGLFFESAPAYDREERRAVFTVYQGAEETVVARYYFGWVTLVVIVYRAARSELCDPVVSSASVYLAIYSSNPWRECIVEQGIVAAAQWDALAFVFPDVSCRYDGVVFAGELVVVDCDLRNLVGDSLRFVTRYEEADALIAHGGRVAAVVTGIAWYVVVATWGFRDRSVCQLV